MVIFLSLSSAIIGYISYKTLNKNIDELTDMIVSQFIERHKDLVLIGDTFTLTNKVREFIKKRKIVVYVRIYDKKNNTIIDEKKEGKLKEKAKLKKFIKEIKNGDKRIGIAEIYIDVDKYKKITGKILLTLLTVISTFLIFVLIISISINRTINDEIKKLEDVINQKEIDEKMLLTSEFRIREIKNYIKRIKDDIYTIKSLEDEIERKSNLAMIGNFTASIVHDIKNPLTVILSYSEMIEILSKNEKIKENVKKIKYSAIKIKRMLDDILSFLKEQDIEMEITPRDPEKVLTYVIENLEPLIYEKNIDLSVNINTNSKCFADGYRLSRAIENILKNAIEASDKGSKIEIKVEEKDKYMLFKIRDYAGGIPDEIKESIFEPFTTKAKKHGTGLGLFITKTIVEKHKGRVYFLEHNDGTEFVIEIPKA